MSATTSTSRAEHHDAVPPWGRPGPALLFGLYSLIYGVSQIMMGVQLRQARHTVHSVMENAA